MIISKYNVIEVICNSFVILYLFNVFIMYNKVVGGEALWSRCCDVPSLSGKAGVHQSCSTNSSRQLLVDADLVIIHATLSILSF